MPGSCAVYASLCAARRAKAHLCASSQNAEGSPTPWGLHCLQIFRPYGMPLICHCKSAAVLSFCLLSQPHAADTTPSAPATIITEAEEFRVLTPPGWKAQKYGDNYYVGTFANTFL